MKFLSFSSSLKWVSVAQATRQVVTIGTTVLFAKILTPQDFGIIGLAMTLLGFLNLFRDIGTSSAIIKSEQVSKVMLSSLFWINLLLGLAASVVLYVCSPSLSRFFNQANLQNVLELLSLVFIVNSFSIVQQASLEKNMRFKRLAIVEIISVIGGAVAGIIVAFRYQSVFCFPIQQLVTAGLTSFFLFFFSSWFPSIVFKIKEIRSIARYSVNLTGFGLVNYFARNLDNIIIGKFLGMQQLGYYNLAYKIILFPIQNISGVVSRVMFPTLSKLGSEQEIKDSYLKFLELIAYICFPIMMWVFIMDDLLVKVLFNEKWLGAILLIRIFVPIGLVQSLAYTTGTLFMIKSKTGVLFVWGIVCSTAFALSFLFGVQWGIMGVAISYAIVYLIIAYFEFKISFRFIGLHIKEMLIVLKHPFFLSVQLSLLVFGTRILMEWIAPGKNLLNFTLVSCLTGFYMLFFIRKAPSLWSFVSRKKLITTE